MSYLGNHEKAITYTNRAIAKITELGLVLDPHIFAIWYDYFADNNLDLIHAIDEIVAREQDITPAFCEDLYRRFFTDEHALESVRDTSRQIQDELASLASQLQTAGGDTARYGEALEEFSGEVAKSGPDGDFGGLIAKMMAETRAMQQRARDLESELRTSSEHISTLKKDLEKAQFEADTDILTGIANRKNFDTSLALLSEQANHTEEKLSLILGDVDHFKRFNDTWGHQLGDQVLKLVATTLKSNVKGKDVAGRYGGEEFVILLPNTTLAGAKKLADQLRYTVQSKKLVKKSSGEDIGFITMSFGVAEFLPGEPPAEFVRRADQAMYAAKNSGRNRVIAYEAS